MIALPLPAREAVGTIAREPRPILLAPRELAALAVEVRALLAPAPGLDARLAGAVGDTLETPGSLWRAQLAVVVGREHGLGERDRLALASGIEAFHTASLLFDDLPAMDDASERRGRPAAHRVHGEAAATLAALAFVHRGYARVWSALVGKPAAVGATASELIEECLGLAGILDGQARDVHFRGAAAGRGDEVLRIARGKTVTLLRLALELPAVVAAAPRPRRERLGRLAGAWGLAYQILDDLEDAGEGAGDAAEGGVDGRLGRPNLAVAVGRRRAQARLGRELTLAARLIAELAGELPGCGAPFARLTAHLAGQRSGAASPRPIVAG